MIVLNNNPIAGSSLKLGLSFRDSLGTFYTPISVCYTLLALNNDEEDWSVVGDYYKVPLVPSSTIALTIPNLQLVEGTTTDRKVLVEYSAYTDGQYSAFIDEVIFNVREMPVISNIPPTPSTDPIYVKVTDVSLQVGNLESVPVNPVFKCLINLPVSIDDATINIQDGEGNVMECTVLSNSTYNELTIYPKLPLNPLSSYSLHISDLISKVNDYQMESPYMISFVTADLNTQSKSIVITENTTVTVLPDEGYTLSSVTVETKFNDISLYGYKDEDNDVVYWSASEITETGRYIILSSAVLPDFVSRIVTVSDDVITMEIDDNTVTLVRDSSEDISSTYN